MYKKIFRIMTEKCKPFVSLSEVKCKPYHKWIHIYIAVRCFVIYYGLIKL